MTAVLAARPAHDGGAPARRAVLRWAWRLFRREWRQQLAVLALIVAAVGATIVAAGVGPNTRPPANAGFGSANHLVTLGGTDPHLAADIASLSARLRIDVIENASLPTGLSTGAQLRAQDPTGAYGGPMLALVSGRYPVAAGEVAMTHRLASTFNVHVGDVWHRDGRAFQVVGLVENPENLLDNFALVAPGQLAAPRSVTVLFDASPAEVAALHLPQGAVAITPRHGSGISPAVVVLVFAIFGLTFIGLVAAAGFTVLAQRRLRALGMLSSLGATDRNVRLVMVANGAVVGAVGAVLGAAIGLSAWIAYAPRMSISAHHRVAWTSLPWWLVVAAMVLAVITATLASRRPARTVTDVPVVAALSGRPAPPKAVRRSAVPGAVLLAIGVGFLAFSGGWGGHNPPFLLLGILATAAGLLFFAPVCVAGLGTVAGHAPLAPRIALRDLARYRARSGPAVAATSLAVLMAVLVCLVATGRYADAFDYFGANLPSNQLVVSPPDLRPVGPGPDLGPVGPGPDLGPVGPGPGHGFDAPRAVPQSPAALEAHASAIAASVGSHDVLRLDSPDAMLVKGSSIGATSAHGSLYVATPELLHRYRIDPAAIDPTTMVITSRPGLEGTSDLYLTRAGFGVQRGAVCTPTTCVANPKIQTFSQLPRDTSDPNLLVTEAAVRYLNLQVTPAGWLVQTARPLTATQVNSARQAAASTGMTIETKSQAPTLAQLRNYATAAGILLALGVLALTVGLIRSETAGDLRTLTATGASSRTRRAITSATAGTLGLLGALLGTAVAYIATVAFFRTQLTERMSHVPVLDLLLVLVGLPLVATAGGWLFAGRQPPAIARRPLE